MELWSYLLLPHHFSPYAEADLLEWTRYLAEKSAEFPPEHDAPWASRTRRQVTRKKEGANSYIKGPSPARPLPRYMGMGKFIVHIYNTTTTPTPMFHRSASVSIGHTAQCGCCTSPYICGICRWVYFFLFFFFLYHRVWYCHCVMLGLCSTAVNGSGVVVICWWRRC